jgi:hypothetical protein
MDKPGSSCLHNCRRQLRLAAQSSAGASQSPRMPGIRRECDQCVVRPSAATQLIVRVSTFAYGMAHQCPASTYIRCIPLCRRLGEGVEQTERSLETRRPSGTGRSGADAGGTASFTVQTSVLALRPRRCSRQRTRSDDMRQCRYRIANRRRSSDASSALVFAHLALH